MVNDDITQIEEFNFDGIHLGQSDISPIFAKHVHKEKIIGLSCYNSISLANQYLDYIDYVSFGAMHRSLTKKNAREISQAELQKIIKFKIKLKFPFFNSCSFFTYLEKSPKLMIKIEK